MKIEGIVLGLLALVIAAVFWSAILLSVMGRFPLTWEALR